MRRAIGIVLLALLALGSELVGQAVRAAPAARNTRKTYEEMRTQQFGGIKDIGEAGWGDVIEFKTGREGTTAAAIGPARDLTSFVFTPRGTKVPVKVTLSHTGIPGRPTIFNARTIELDVPGMLARDTNVNWTPGLRIYGRRASIYEDRTEQVALNDGGQLIDAFGSRRQAALNVYGAQGSSFSLTGSDLAALRIQNPVKFEEHSRPILDLLAGGLVMVPERHVALQVLPEAADLDGPGGKKIEEALANLASTDLKVARAAEATLLASSVEAWIFLQGRKPADLTPEQLVQVDRLRDEVSLLPEATLKQLRGDVGFLLDACLSSDAAIAAAARARIKKLIGREVAGTTLGEVSAFRRALLAPATRPAAKKS